MFSKFVYILLNFFNVCGFCTELSELRPSRWRHRKWTILVLAFNIIHLCCMWGVCWGFLDCWESHTNSNLLDFANDIVKFTGASIVHLFVIIEAYSKQSVQRKFWRIFHEVRTDFNRSDRDLMFRSYFAKFGEFFGAMAVIECMQLSRWSIGDGEIYFLTAMFSLRTMTQFRIFQYLFFIHLLNHQLNEVEMETKSLADISENEQVSRHRLRWIRMYHNLVFGLCDCINEVFGWSNVISISYMFLRLVLDLIWNYMVIHRDNGIGVEGSTLYFHK